MPTELVDFIEFMNKSQSGTIQDLALKFGGVTVYSRGEYQISAEVASQIAEVLNQHIFNGKIQKIPLLVLSVAEIDKDRKRDSVEYDSLASRKFYGMFSCLYDFVVNGEFVDDLSQYEGEVDLKTFASVKVRSRFQKIYLNSDELQHFNFIFNVNTLCHEMIHKYAYDFGSFQHMLKVESYYKAKFNSHSDPVFKQMKEKAMKEHLKIIDDGSGLDYQKLNDEAYNFMVCNEDMFDGKKKLKVFKTEEGEWVVDMTQFADSAHSKTVSKQYRSLQYCD